MGQNVSSPIQQAHPQTGSAMSTSLQQSQLLTGLSPLLHSSPQSEQYLAHPATSSGVDFSPQSLNSTPDHPGSQSMMAYFPGQAFQSHFNCDSITKPKQ